MAKSVIEKLKHAGLLNQDAEPLSGIASKKDYKYNRATFCSSIKCCTEYTDARGTLVHVGKEFLRRCPRCTGTAMYHTGLHERDRAWAKYREQNED